MYKKYNVKQTHTWITHANIHAYTNIMTRTEGSTAIGVSPEMTKKTLEQMGMTKRIGIQEDPAKTSFQTNIMMKHQATHEVQKRSIGP